MVVYVVVYAAGTLILGCLGWFLYRVAKWQREQFEKRFPPISDAEFLAHCRPGTNPAVALKVRRIVADSLGVEYERIYPSTRFVDDLQVD